MSGKRTTPHVGVSNPGLSAVGQSHFAAVFRSDLLELFIDVLDHEIGGLFDGEVGNESDREFALDRAGNDGLGTRCR